MRFQRRWMSSRPRLLAAIFGATALTGSILVGFPANATSATVDEGGWDSAYYSTVSCTTGTLSWRCAYTAHTSSTDGSTLFSTCQEAGANTGNVTADVACAADFSATLTAEWVFDAAGHKTGCTSVAGSDSGYADYYSGIDASFNRTAMPITAEVRNGVVTVRGEDASFSSSGLYYETWAFHWQLPASTCSPGLSVSSFGATAPGSVTVSYADTAPQG